MKYVLVLCFAYCMVLYGIIGGNNIEYANVTQMHHLHI